MKIAAVQMVATPDVERNLQAAARLVAQAAAQGASMVLLPEYFCLMGRRDDDKLRAAEASGDGPIQQCLADLAHEHKLWLVGGTLPLRTAHADRVRNACCVFGPDGAALARYDKIHLFAYDNGAERYDEARVLEAGSEPLAVQLGALRVGLSICYDLRFPEHYRALMRPPLGLHLHHGPRALGAAAARARRREPVLRARCRAGWCARERPAHLGPQHGRRPLGRGAGRAARRRGRGARRGRCGAAQYRAHAAASAGASTTLSWHRVTL